jgi:L-iditol 2-dehydrogenase
MKKVVIRGERDAGLSLVPDPAPKEDWALVKVMATPMCTEYKLYRDGVRAEYLGHEAVGEVVAVAQPCRVKVGDRVVVMPQYPCGVCPACVAGDYVYCEHNVDFAEYTGSPEGRTPSEGRATYAQYLLKPSWLLPLIPEGVSYEHAGLALCGLGPSFGAFQRMGLSAFDTVLIVGLGPVGLGAVVNARFRGSRVIGVEPNRWRAERARQMGADLVLDPNDPALLTEIHALTDGRGVDAALDCSGTAVGERLLIDAARRRGRVAFVGECQDPLTLTVSPDMLRKGLTVIGSWHYNLNDYPAVMQVIRESPLVDLLISHVMPMFAAKEAFELQMTGECAKIILKPWD